MTQLGLNIVTMGASSDNADAKVQFQSEPAGTSVEVGTVINLTMSMTRAANFGKDAAICEMEHQQAAPLRLCKEEKRGMLSKASPFLIEQGKIPQNQTLEKW